MLSASEIEDRVAVAVDPVKPAAVAAGRVGLAVAPNETFEAVPL